MAKRLTIELLAMVMLGLLIGLLGPFGTFDNPPAVRMLSWVVWLLAGYIFFRPTGVVADWLCEATGLPRFAGRLSVMVGLAEVPDGRDLYDAIWIEACAVVRQGDSERLAQIARAPGVRRGRDAGPPPTRGHTVTTDDASRTEQYGTGHAISATNHVGAHMDSVTAVGVQVPGRPEHHRTPGRRPTERVRSRIRPGSRWWAAIGLDLDHGRDDVPAVQRGAEQPSSRGHRIDDE